MSVCAAAEKKGGRICSRHPLLGNYLFRGKSPFLLFLITYAGSSKSIFWSSFYTSLRRAFFFLLFYYLTHHFNILIFLFHSISS